MVKQPTDPPPPPPPPPPAPPCTTCKGTGWVPGVDAHGHAWPGAMMQQRCPVCSGGQPFVVRQP